MASAWGSSWGVSWGDSFGVLSDTPVIKPVPSGAGGGAISKLQVVHRVRGRTKLGAISCRAFPVRVAGRGKAHTQFSVPSADTLIPAFKVGGSARFTLNAAPASVIKLPNGAIIAKGLHDVSDTEVVAMILALLDL